MIFITLIHISCDAEKQQMPTTVAFPSYLVESRGSDNPPVCPKYLGKVYGMLLLHGTLPVLQSQKHMRRRDTCIDAAFYINGTFK